MVKRFVLVSFGVLCLMTSTLIGFHMGQPIRVAQANIETSNLHALGHNAGYSIV